MCVNLEINSSEKETEKVQRVASYKNILKKNLVHPYQISIIIVDLKNTNTLLHIYTFHLLGSLLCLPFTIVKNKNNLLQTLSRCHFENKMSSRRSNKSDDGNSNSNSPVRNDINNIICSFDIILINCKKKSG